MWHRLLKSGELSEGSMASAPVGDLLLAIYRIKGQVYATSNICTHQFAVLTEGYLDDDCIECPIHQGRFHVPTGKAQGDPVEEDLKTYPAREEEGYILVEVA